MTTDQELFTQPELFLGVFTDNPKVDPAVLKKRAKNQDDYAKNKEKILEQARSRYQKKKQRNQEGENVISLFPKEALAPSTRVAPGYRRNRFAFSKLLSKRVLMLLFFQILVAAMTYFLMTETAQFYSAQDPGGINPWLKAGLLEGAVIAFAFMGTKAPRKKGVGRIMSFAIYAYTLWAVSGNALTQTGMAHEQSEIQRKEVIALEAEIHKLTLLRDRYFETHRTTLAMKIQQELLEVRHRKEKLEGNVLNVPSPTLLWNTLLTLVVFRLLVMITNLFCLQELARRYRLYGRGV